MDYDSETESNGVGRGPFYGAAAFIFVTVILFASVALKENGSLNHWQVSTCLLGTGLIAVFLFLPHVIQQLVARMEDNSSRTNGELESKSFLELKEIRSELDALAVKIDKVPTVVNQIVSDSIQLDNNPYVELIERLNTIQQELGSKLDHLADSNQSLALVEESESKIENLLQQTKQISHHLKELFTKLDSIVLEQSSDGSNLIAPPITPPITGTEHPEISDSDPVFSEENPAKDEANELGEPMDQSPEDTDAFPAENLTEELTESIEDIEEVILPPTSIEIDESNETPISLEDDEIEELAEEEEVITDQTDKNSPDELDLGLPDPAETLRKVDALLAGEDTQKPLAKSENIDDKKDQNGTTTVVANVMIGIGNKPFLRGEGPGLSWDEGVSMNFIEIGKWAWSPPRKNASLTVQVYRNDQDPDKGGKVEVRPGEKLEITPDFN